MSLERARGRLCCAGIALLVAAVACAGEPRTGSAVDGGGARDAGAADASSGVDASSIDAGDPDAGMRDAAPADARIEDARVPDAAPDAAPTDAAPTDSAPTDAAPTDTAAPDAGFADAGLPPDSGPCRIVGPGSFDIDVPAVTVTGRLTVNGSRASGRSGQFFLENTATGDEAMLGDPSSIDPYMVEVIPGSYTLSYGYRSTLLPVNIPANRRVPIRPVTVTQSGTLDADVRAVTISGALGVGGMPGVGPGGRIELVNPSTGDSAEISRFGFNGSITSYSALVAPGTYDVHYRSHGDRLRSGPLRNTDVRFMTGVTITATRTLDIDVPRAELGGWITVAGMGSFGTGGEVQLRNPQTGDRATLGGVSSGFQYRAPVGPSTYDLYYVYTPSFPSSGSIQNRQFRLQSGVVVSTDATMDIDVPFSRLDGNFTVNGVNPDSGSHLVARNPLTEDEAFLGVPSSTSYRAYIIAGVYDLYLVVSGIGTSRTVRNRSGLLQRNVDFTSSRRFDYDIVAHRMTGQMTINGVMGSGGLFYLERSGDRVLLGPPGGNGGAYDIELLPGTYDAYYSNTLFRPTTEAPRNTHAVFRRAVTISGSTNLDLDFSATRLEGRLLVNAMQRGAGLIDFVNRNGIDRAHIGITGRAGPYEAFVAPGTYDIVHTNPRPDLSGTVMNTYGAVGCVVVP